MDGDGIRTLTELMNEIMNMKDTLKLKEQRVHDNEDRYRHALEIRIRVKSHLK